LGKGKKKKNRFFFFSLFRFARVDRTQDRLLCSDDSPNRHLTPPARAEVLSLLCPISGKRIKVGCKGRSCDHAQCFDRAVRAPQNKNRFDSFFLIIFFFFFFFFFSFPLFSLCGSGVCRREQEKRRVDLPCVQHVCEGARAERQVCLDAESRDSTC
jgi:hypothetical protein